MTKCECKDCKCECTGDCEDCKCKRTYVYEKDHGHDISYENEVEYD